MDKRKHIQPFGPGKGKRPYPNSYWKEGHWYDLTTYDHLCHPDKPSLTTEQKYELLKARLGEIKPEVIFAQVKPIWGKKPTPDEEKVILGFMAIVLETITNRIKKIIKDIEKGV